MNVTFKCVVTLEQINVVINLANTIWTEHYTPIIGKDQVAYMLRTYHSVHTISKEVNDKDTYYYLIFRGSSPVGYVGIRVEEKNLFLSKIYILSQERGYGLGRQAVEFIKDFASTKQLEKITLTVNKNNVDTIASYKKMGFKITGNLCLDIGEGYVMDDYAMELSCHL